MHIIEVQQIKSVNTGEKSIQTELQESGLLVIW